MRNGQPGEGMVFTSVDEIQQALDASAVTLHSKIACRREGYDEDEEPVVTRVETTPGRMLLGQILPDHVEVPFSLINQILTKKEITHLIDVVYRHCGQKTTVIFCDQLMSMPVRPGSPSARTTWSFPRPRRA